MPAEQGTAALDSSITTITRGAALSRTHGYHALGCGALVGSGLAGLGPQA